MKRRDFLKLTALSTAAASCNQHGAPKIAGELKGAPFRFGHILKDGKPPSPVATHAYDIVIIGGGIAGLAAAYNLQKKGIKNFILLELDAHCGGNSSSGKNSVSAYPWGAHYLPVPGKDAPEVIDLLKDFGVVTGFDTSGKPIYREDYLCFAPEERLYIHGHFQEGLIPTIGTTKEDAEEFSRFFSEIASLQNRRCSDGKAAFAVPLERSSHDPELRELDTRTFASWLALKNFTSEYLIWYLNYCCRDDYGADVTRVSAWAGIHYFASRNPHASKIDEYTLLTWPAGNGWLVQKFLEKTAPFIQTNSLVFRIEENGALLCYRTDSGETHEYRAQSIIYASPQFALPYIAPWIKGIPQFEYAPWLVANITLTALPKNSQKGVPWDTVLYRSRSLGYVSATHQSLSITQAPSVWTYYLPLDELPPKEARAQALATSLETWQEMVMRDLSHVHPDIRDLVSTVDIWVWGHGMRIPTPGFLTPPSVPHFHNLFFAHSDLSGISIFEEAYYQGFHAAEKAARALEGT